MSIFQQSITINQSSEGWNPPVHWNWETVSSQVQDGQNAFIGLFVLYPNVINAVRLIIGVENALGGSISWGDGSTSSITAYTNDFEHIFDYNAISAPEINGHKIITISGQSTGFLSQFNIKSHPSCFISTQQQMQGWLAIKVRSSLASILYYAQNPNNQNLMRILDFGNLKIGQMALFRFHQSLMILKFGGFSYNLSGNYNFSGCALPDFDWNLIDYSQCMSFSQMWLGSVMMMPYMLNIDINSCTSLYQAWQSSSSFQQIKLRNTGNVTTIQQAIYGASVRSFEMDNCSNVTVTTLFTMSTGSVLQRLILTGLRVGIDITNQQMTATALNDFFNSLGTANGSQTVTIKGCIGALTCDRSIATNKGFTVVYQ